MLRRAESQNAADRWRRWAGADRPAASPAAILLVTAWRLAGMASVSAVWLPVMRIGRRPYTARRLADRLDAVRDMELAPPWLADVLRWLVVVAVITAVTAVVTPVAWRRAQLLAPVVLVVLALVVKRASESSSWTASTSWLLLVGAFGLVAAVAAALPLTSRSGVARASGQ